MSTNETFPQHKFSAHIAIKGTHTNILKQTDNTLIGQTKTNASCEDDTHEWGDKLRMLASQSQIAFGVSSGIGIIICTIIINIST